MQKLLINSCGLRWPPTKKSGYNFAMFLCILLSNALNLNKHNFFNVRVIPSIIYAKIAQSSLANSVAKIRFRLLKLEKFAK